MLGADNCGVSCSIGVVTVLDAAASIDHALAAADKLMYEVKRNGKGATVFGGGSENPSGIALPGMMPGMIR